MVMVCTLLASFTCIICLRIYHHRDKNLEERFIQTQEDFKEIFKENRSLKGSLAMAKKPKLPNDINEGNIADVALGLLPKKYHKIAKPLIPKLEEYITNNPEKLQEILDKVKGVNQKPIEANDDITNGSL